MKQPIETVLFDFGGTLDADGLAWKERFHAQYRAEGLDMTPESFARAFYAADDALAGRLPRDADLAVTVHRLAAGLDQELARRDARRVAERFLAEADAAFARNRPVLEALQARYRLGIVSNFYGNLEAVCRGAGLAPHFAVIVDSHKVGAAKPDAAIFRAALEPLGARPETTLLVGDSLPRDREGARRLGMGFVWIAPRDVRDAAAAAGDALDHQAIARLGELAELLM
ncbi:MAG TPA: HAD family hydrolase [Stellaceae bacterium]|nr:HAD family hydrolase [Stellaceae bacterium]